MDVQTATVVITGISIIIGIIVFILSRRQELETRQAALFMQVYNRWTQRDVVKAYGMSRYQYLYDNFDEFLQKYHVTANPEAYTDLMMLCAFFEGLGILVKKGLIDINLVEDLFSQRIMWLWEEKATPNVDRARQLTNDPTQFDSIEYLYNLMKQRQHAPVVST